MELEHQGGVDLVVGSDFSNLKETIKSDKQVYAGGGGIFL